MLKAYTYRIYPTVEQSELLQKTFGCCRFIYNWALDTKIKYHQKDEKIGKFGLMHRITELKYEHEWLREVGSQVLQQEIYHLDNAFSNFFRKDCKEGFPKFKSKHRSRKSFSCPQSCKVDFEKGKLSIPKCKDIKAIFSRTFEGEIKTVTISQSKGGRYFASILVDDGKELPKKKPVKPRTSVGIDVGIKHFATLSTGEKIDNPKHLKTYEPRLKVLQKRLSRKVKGSCNREKARVRVAKLHELIANQRKDFLHKVSTKIIRENQTVIIEDLHVKGMLKNHCLAKAISDCGWSQFKEFLRYKSEWYGKNLIEIGRFEPSSKLCSCGVINQQLKLSDREWVCNSCNTKHDRDTLAAQNIKKFGFIQAGILPVSLWSSPDVGDTKKQESHSL